MYRESSMGERVFPIFSYLSGVQLSVTNLFCSHRKALKNSYIMQGVRKKNKIFSLIGSKRNFGIAESQTKNNKN
jgi:hypothetical protein